MPPADSAPDEGGLYQPPRPPLPVPVPYTHPNPTLPATPARPQIFPAGGYTVRHGAPPSTINSGPPTTNFVGIPLPGMATGPPPAAVYHTAQPLQPSRYAPFQQTQEYHPPPNPRVGAAGLPPSAVNSQENAAISPVTFMPPLGGPGSLSCPTSLSLQGNGYTITTTNPRTTASGLAAGGASVPGPGCWSLPRNTLGEIQENGSNGCGSVEQDTAPVNNVGAIGSPSIKGDLGSNHQLSLDTEELKTRSLPTRCMHGARAPPPPPPRRNMGEGTGEMSIGDDTLMYGETLEEGDDDDDLYGSSEDLSSGPSILEKLMVWAYYNAEEQDMQDDDQGIIVLYHILSCFLL